MVAPSATFAGPEIETSAVSASSLIVAVETTLPVLVSVPLVVRLEGTNVEAGRQALAESGLNLIVGEGMADAAEKVVAAVGGAS